MMGIGLLLLPLSIRKTKTDNHGQPYISQTTTEENHPATQEATLPRAAAGLVGRDRAALAPSSAHQGSPSGDALLRPARRGGHAPPCRRPAGGGQDGDPPQVYRRRPYRATPLHRSVRPGRGRLQPAGARGADLQRPSPHRGDRGAGHELRR